VRRLRNLLTILAIIAVLDAGFSSYCRNNCAFSNHAYPSTDHRIRSEAYHHGLAPNLEIEEAWGMRRYTYATNSLGFKDSAPRTVSPRSNKRRMLFLGDSFTEGKGFPFEQTFVGLIAQEMERRGVEVLNGGVDSYAPAIYLRKARYLIEDAGFKFNTVVVFLDVSDIYDQAMRYGYDDRGWQSYGERGRRRAKAEMDKLAELLKRHGTRMILAVYPWPDQLFHDPESPRHRGFWRRWAEARAIPFVDLLPAFTEGDPNQTLESLFIHNDFHWNAEGHRRVADVFMASQDRFVPF